MILSDRFKLSHFYFLVEESNANAEFWDFCTVLSKRLKAKTSSSVLATKLVGCICANIVIAFAMSYNMCNKKGIKAQPVAIYTCIWLLGGM